MDEIILRIIDLDNRARGIVGEARAERHAREETMRAIIDEYRAATEEAYKKKLDEIAARIKAETEAGVRQIEDSVKVRISEMRDYAQRHKGEWVDMFFDRIVGGEPQ